MNELEEQRVIEALRAIPGGLTVTERDILTASNRLMDNLEPPSPRRRSALVAAAAAAVVIIGFVVFQVVGQDDDAAPQPAPAPPSPAEELAGALQPDAYIGDDFTAGARPTAQDLAGFWLMRSPHGENVLLVDADGDWTHGDFQDRFATSTLASDTWTRHLDSAVFRNCLTNNLPWTAAIAGDGSLHLELSGRDDCTPAGSREVWDRLIPGPSPVLDYLRETSGDIDWVAATDSNLSGLFINLATGHVLDVAENGSYVYLDSVTGQEIDPSDQGTLEATAGAIAGSCEGGNFSATFEVGKTAAVPGHLMAYDAMKVTGSGGDCSGDLGTDAVWIKLF